jgi:hypothetical protein
MDISFCSVLLSFFGGNHHGGDAPLFDRAVNLWGSRQITIAISIMQRTINGMIDTLHSTIMLPF